MKHAVRAHKNKNYFQRILSQNKKQECYMKLSFTVSEKALIGADKGFAAWVKCQNPAIQITHCCINREALMIKLLTQELFKTMSNCIEIVNLIKAKKP